MKSFKPTPLVQPAVGVSQPLYAQVQATLQEMIEGIEFEPGDQIPSERELSEMLGVSRMTARRAVENLIQLGLLERRSTNGTYVREPQVVRPVGTQPVQSLTQILAGRGQGSGSKLLHFEVIRAPRKVAQYLNLRVGELVVMLRRLRLSDDKPFCVETSYFPAEIVPNLQPSDVHDNSSFYELLKSRYHIQFGESQDELKLSRCLPDEAEWLGLKEGDPVLFMRGIVLDMDGRHIEYLKSVNHPEMVSFSLITKL